MAVATNVDPKKKIMLYHPQMINTLLLLCTLKYSFKNTMHDVFSYRTRKLNATI